MIMSTARATLRALRSSEGDPARLIGRLNTLLEEDIADDAFMTMALARLGADGGCAYVSAGHEPPLVYRAGGASFDELDHTGLMLGVLDEFDYSAQPVPPLARGDILVLFTDGIFEAQAPPTFAQWGMDALRAAIAANARQGAQAVCDAVVAAVGAHLGEAAPHDDMTIVVAERL
jgi:sigma-B regulation protein RsbU (phosphoserine phosphatase)